MVTYDQFHFNPMLTAELKKLKLDFVFQPIFYSDAKRVFAYEALMRPRNCSISELIDKYYNDDKLHVLEIATVFGACQEYVNRGYTCGISINSFPTEFMTYEENSIFNNYFSKAIHNGIVEILEYPEIDRLHWKIKRQIIESNGFRVAVDDYGTGVNKKENLSFYEPDFIKLDRELIAGIETDKSKQERVLRLLNKFHSQDILVVAEGIETKDECEWLQNAGVDLLQGYYLQRPY